MEVRAAELAGEIATSKWEELDRGQCKSKLEDSLKAKLAEV